MRTSFIAAVVLLGAVLWSYWSVMLGLFRDWKTDDNYSVGQLVPLAIVYLLWHDRARLKTCPVKPSWLAGLAILIAAQAGRAFGVVWLFESAERYALILTVVGVVVLVAGFRAAWRFKWLLVFLFLMIPLPGRVHDMISGPLQDYATSGAIFTLELIGVDISGEGHVIIIGNDKPLAVAEACSGLRMLTAFLVVGSTLAYLIRRPLWQKAALVLSSFPVAILCNVGRLVVTALLFQITNDEFAERFFHDFAGFFMMPLAVAMLVLELWIMAKLVVEDAPPPAAHATS